MAFDCLVLCDELESLRVLCKALDEAEINRDICTDPDEAGELLNRRKYEAVIVDCDGMNGGAGFLRNIRRAPSNQNASVFALIAGTTTVPKAFQKGANFALLKPLLPEVVARSLRAAHNLMLQERRRWFRHTVQIVVEMKPAEGAIVHCVSRNLSEGGMGLRAVKGATPNQELEIRFRIPGEQSWIEGKCEIKWVDKAGNAGVRFLNLANVDYKRLRDWLTEQFEQAPPSLFVNSVQRTKH